jgi:hypothetical protein
MSCRCHQDEFTVDRTAEGAVRGSDGKTITDGALGEDRVRNFVE